MHWSPTSVSELEQAVNTHTVVETTFLGFKRFPTQTDSGRKEVAKDLAAMSIHGGTIVFGVDELTGGQFTLAPAELDGWREWVSQIGANSVQPSVAVQTRPLVRDDGTGYLVVSVAASALAPHMAGGRYYGRSDTTNRVLADFEVRELWQRHLRRNDDALELLQHEVERDPTPPELRNNAHLFVVAQPLSTDRRLLLDAVPAHSLRDWARDLHLAGDYSPNGMSASTLSRRAFGVGKSTYEIGPDRKLRPNGNLPPSERGLWDLEVREDGGLRLFNARASDTSRGPAGLCGALIVGEVSNVVDLARRVSTLAEFRGSWTFCVAVTGLRSQIAHNPGGLTSEDSYSEDEYREIHEAHHHQLFAAGSPILDALIGRFCRSSLPAGQTPATLDLWPQPEPA
jgi:hypothetical protein